MSLQDRINRAPGWLVALLNLPVTTPSETTPPSKGPKAGTPSPTPAENPYLQIAQGGSRPLGRPTPSARWSTSSAPSTWQAQASTRRGSVWLVALRGLVAVALVLAVLIAIPAVIRTYRPATATGSSSRTVRLPAAATFPAAAAGGVAARFAAAYLSWDGEKPETRERALAAAGWTGSPDVGWDGKGRQQLAGPVTVAQVDAETAEKGAVTVVGDVTPWLVRGDKLAPSTTTTVALRVPMTVTADGRVQPAAAPSLVAPPRNSAPAGVGLPETDSRLTSETKQAAQDFFTAYGSSADLTAIAAPGASITGLSGAVTLVRISDWDVAPPTDDQAAAVASVLWRTRDGAQLEQTYRLNLRLTTSGPTGRWQVLTIL